MTPAGSTTSVFGRGGIVKSAATAATLANTARAHAAPAIRIARSLIVLGRVAFEGFACPFDD
jgi:hypothetical protein